MRFSLNPNVSPEQAWAAVRGHLLHDKATEYFWALKNTAFPFSHSHLDLAMLS